MRRRIGNAFSMMATKHLEDGEHQTGRKKAAGEDGLELMRMEKVGGESRVNRPMRAGDV